MPAAIQQTAINEDKMNAFYGKSRERLWRLRDRF